MIENKDSDLGHPKIIRSKISILKGAGGGAGGMSMKKSGSIHVQYQVDGSIVGHLHRVPCAVHMVDILVREPVLNQLPAATFTPHRRRPAGEITNKCMRAHAPTG